MVLALELWSRARGTEIGVSTLKGMIPGSMARSPGRNHPLKLPNGHLTKEPPSRLQVFPGVHAVLALLSLAHGTSTWSFPMPCSPCLHPGHLPSSLTPHH